MASPMLSNVSHAIRRLDNSTIKDMKVHPYLDEKGVAIFAHRGGALEAPENTLAAFQYAVSLGCHYLETDVQLSKDGIPYIFHDDDLLRVAGIAKKFGALNSNEINALKIFGVHFIPTLQEVLQKFPDTKFNIDLKTDAVAGPALKVIRELNAARRICIASFSDDRIGYARAHLPQACFSMGPDEITSLKLKTWRLSSKIPQGHCVQVPVYKYGVKIVTRRFVKKAHELGLKVHVWTINDAPAMQRLIDTGVDGIMTDRPGLLKTLL